MLSKIINIVGAVVMSLMLSYVFAVMATDENYPPFITMVVCFAIGFFVPQLILKWIYKEDNKESKAEESQSDDQL